MTLIDEGVAASLVYDFRAATGHGVEPTGHGLPAPSAEGALPMHLSLLPGQTPRPTWSPAWSGACWSPASTTPTWST